MVPERDQATVPEVTERAVAFETPWFQVISKKVSGLPESIAAQPFFVIEPPDYVTVLALTTTDKVLLVRQYRPAVEGYMLELPSGHVDAGELPDEAARRELLEETGYLARDVELLGCLDPDTGRLGNRLWCYFASGVRVEEGAKPVMEEGLTVVSVGRVELPTLIREGRLSHALNLAAITLALIRGQLTFS